MTPADRAEAVSLLVRSRLRPGLVPTLSDRWPTMQTRDAYRIQEECLREWAASGRTLLGYKILLTRPELQQRFHTREPAFGRLLDDSILADRSVVDVASVVHATAEPEVAFQLGRDVSASWSSLDEVRCAIRTVAASIEIPTRHMAWGSKLTNVVADNGGAGYAVIGRPNARGLPPTLRGLNVVVRKNGVPVAQGNTDAAYGDPVRALAWLARRLALVGQALKAGQVIMTGSCTPAIEVQPGDIVDVEIQSIGCASAQFADLRLLVPGL